VIDLIRAKTFYENVFNWKFLRYGESSVVHFKSGSVTGIVHQVEEYDHYTLVHDHSQGAMISKTGKRAAARSVGFTIQVEDLDNTLNEVKKAGGRMWL
jgi:predicted enzyme related to lactoylglutathione lyase